VVPAGRALSHNLRVFVDLKTRLLEMRDHPIGEHLAGITRRVLRQIRRSKAWLGVTAKPIEKASWSRKERWSTGPAVLVLFWPVIARPQERCQGARSFHPRNH
jgi:hypothetical protein